MNRSGTNRCQPGGKSRNPGDKSRFAVFCAVALLLGCTGVSQADEIPAACREPEGASPQRIELLEYPLASQEGIATGPGVETKIDAEITEDGNGALVVTVAADPGQIAFVYVPSFGSRLQGQLLYEARIRTAEFEGKPQLAVRWGDHTPAVTRQAMSVPREGGWRWLRLVTAVPTGLSESDSKRLRIGVKLAGTGKLWIDRVRLLSLPAEETVVFPRLPDTIRPEYGLAKTHEALSSTNEREVRDFVRLLGQGRGAQLPGPLQRCVLEIYLHQIQQLATRQRGLRGVLGGFDPRPVFARNYGVMTHRYYQPEYLEQLVAAGPSGTLAETYRHELVDPLMRYVERLLGFEMPRRHLEYFGSDRVDETFNPEIPNPNFTRLYDRGVFQAASVLLDAQGSGEQGFSDAQRQRLRTVFEEHLAKLTQRELLYGDVYHSLFRVLAQLDSGVVGREVPALMERRLATRDRLSSQLAELRLIAELRTPGGAEILRSFRDGEESLEIRDYLDLLLAVHSGAAYLGARSWPAAEIAAGDRPARHPSTSSTP